MIKEINEYRKKYGNDILRGFLNGLNNILVFCFNKKVKRTPLYVGWDVTFRCNSRCSYCTSWKLGLEKKEKELTTEEAVDIIRQLGELKTWI